MTPEQHQEILRLRELKLSPKQIARKLGLRPAEVSTFLKNEAQTAALSRQERGELSPLAHCFINESAARQLLGSNNAEEEIEEKFATGVAEIIVVRKEGSQYSVGGYLVDYWCLGVKDALFYKRLNHQKYKFFVDGAYDSMSEAKQEITLEQAQAIIFGAVEYASRLGFEPHPDFEEAKAHLGKLLENLPIIDFGKDGQPFYISGPYDQPERIISKLEKAVGKGNFGFVMGLG